MNARHTLQAELTRLQAEADRIDALYLQSKATVRDVRASERAMERIIRQIAELPEDVSPAYASAETAYGRTVAYDFAIKVF